MLGRGLMFGNFWRPLRRTYTSAIEEKPRKIDLRLFSIRPINHPNLIGRREEKKTDPVRGGFILYAQFCIIKIKKNKLLREGILP